MTSPFTHINRRTLRHDRRRSIARATSELLPWVFFAAALVQLAHMALSAAVAIHPLTEQAEALKGM